MRDGRMGASSGLSTREGLGWRVQGSGFRLRQKGTRVCGVRRRGEATGRVAQRRPRAPSASWVGAPLWIHAERFGFSRERRFGALSWSG